MDELISELCRQVPDLNKEQVEAQIKAKIDAIGAGYLTDSGAAFLVAADYGVEITKPTAKAGASIKELHAGAREVSLVARVLSISPLKQFTRKDGGQFHLRTMSIYDGPDSTTSVKLWDEKAILPGIDTLRPGDHVKIIKAYVKEDRDGSLAIHIGSNSSIEPADAAEDPIPAIDEIVKDVSEIKEESANLAVSGIMDGDISLMEYTRRSSGEPATALKMRLRGGDGAVTRVVLWGKDMASVPNMIPSAPKIRLLGVSARGADQDLEIHGNESTDITIEGASNDVALDPIIVRILSKPPVMDNGKQAILVVNGKKEMYNVIDTAGVTGPYMEDEIVECMPAQMHGSSVTLDTNSYMRKVEDDGGDTTKGTIPTLAEMRTELQDIKPDGYYCIECMVLKSPERREIQTKTGDSIWLAEIYVGDATGEISVKGWRNQSRMFEGCDRGDKVRIAGLNSKQGLEAGAELVLTPYSKIVKIGE